MTLDITDKREPHKFWLVSPVFIVLLAITILAINNNPGLDGAARSTAMVFWFFPIITWSGYKSILELKLSGFPNWGKFIFLCLWLIPSIPIGLMSLFGLLLISETGLSILL